MDGSANSSRELRIEAEHKLLVALCQPGVDLDMRIVILRRLRDHSFSEPDHEVVYRALAVMPALEPSELQQALTQAVTRMGFPDLDLSELFKQHPPTQDELEPLLARL